MGSGVRGERSHGTTSAGAPSRRSRAGAGLATPSRRGVRRWALPGCSRGGRVAPGGDRAFARRGPCSRESSFGAGRSAGGVARGTPVCGDHLLGRARAPARPGGYPWCRGPFARAAWSPGRVTAQRVRHRGVDGRDALALPRSSRLWAPGPPGAFPAPKAPRGRGVGGGTPGNAWLGGSAGLARPRGLQRRAPASGLAPRPAEWRCEIHIGRGFVPAVFARLPPVSDGYGRAGGGGGCGDGEEPLPVGFVGRGGPCSSWDCPTCFRARASEGR